MNFRLMIVAMGVAVMFITGHAEDFRADLGADLAADAAILVNCWYSHHVRTSMLR